MIYAKGAYGRSVEWKLDNYLNRYGWVVKNQLDQALADTLTRLEAERSWISEKSVGRQIFSK